MRRWDRGRGWRKGASASFDAATFEVWGALLTGGTVVGVPRETLLAPAALAAYLAARQVSVLWLTASVFGMVARAAPAAFNGVTSLLVGGEAVAPAGVRAVRAAGGPAQIVNGYGPTEATTFSVCHAEAGEDAAGERVPIGRPIANTRVYVLDGEGAVVPVGVAGELYIGGDGLARGYWRRPGLTAARFVPDPFGPAGGRLYRTGDRVRYRADGRLEFLGRVDTQVKLRGHRIELGEIETALRAHPAVADAVVVSTTDHPDDQRLVAYVVRKESDTVEASDLRGLLKTSLPDYMIPAAFVMLAALPLTSAGKVDRSALPSADGGRHSMRAEYVAPRTPAEGVLAAIWADVLRVPHVGIDDDFFELGGHSLLATQVCARIRDAFQIDLPLSALFVAPTISSLVALFTDHIEIGPAEDRIARTGPDYEQLLSRIDRLSDDELDALMADRADDGSS